jgi:hypothetical protein
MRTFRRATWHIAALMAIIVTALMAPNAAHATWYWHMTEGESFCCDKTGSMKVASDSAASAGKTASFPWNGSAEKQMNVGNIGKVYHMYLRTRGTRCQDVGPILRVNVWQWRTSGGVYGWHKVVDKATVKPTALLGGLNPTGTKTYSYQRLAVTNAVANQPYFYAQVTMTNDFNGPEGCDRNAYLDQVWFAGWK